MISTSIKKMAKSVMEIAAIMWKLLPSDALGVAAASPLMARSPAATDRNKPRPAGSKLARKAKAGKVGIARIK